MRSLRPALFVTLALAACVGPLEPDAQLPPPCIAPAPLDGSYDALAPGYIVKFANGVSASQESARLATQYGFRLTHVYENFGGFAAEMDSGVVARLRCEHTVAFISRNGTVTGN